MLLTNPVIKVNGDRAIAHVIWTGVTNEAVGTPPSHYEQGREDTELVKRDGKWLISRRAITPDAWQPRLIYSRLDFSLEGGVILLTLLVSGAGIRLHRSNPR